MPPDRDDNAGLWDMLTAAKAVVGFVQGWTLVEYVTDLMLRSAVERQIEIIGEAARRISKEFQAAHPEIPWRPIQAQCTSRPMNTARSITNESGGWRPFTSPN